MEASKSKFLLVGAAVVGLGVVLGTALWLKLGPQSQFGRVSLENTDGLNQYGSVPDFSLMERNGSTVNLARLRGKIWIADFIYTSCVDTCPLQTAMMAKLQEEYAGKPDIQLVSFSVDPERDTPEALTVYADKYHADPKRWFFLTGQRDRIINLVQQGFHLAVAAIPSDADPSGTIPHSPRFVLVDKEGRIRGYYDSGELEAFVRLKNDIDTLAKG
jgi:protein SCO1/2